VAQTKLEKKAHIRGYLLLLLEEGVFARTKTPVEVVARASAAFARDVSAVVGDMATEFGAAGADKLKAQLVGAGAQLLSDLGGRALGHLLKRRQ